MANNLKEQAVETFCIVPELYQQAFQEAGVDFPDELVQRIKEDPQGAMGKIVEDKQLTNAIVQIFEGNQEAIMQAVQQATQGMFKEGGKLQQGLQKFQQGGNLRRQAINSAMATEGYNRSQARTAYRNLRNAGMSKADILANYAPKTQLEDIDITSTEVTPLESTFVMKETALPKVNKLESPTFANAFSAARKAGTPTFTWRGKAYGTDLAEETTVSDSSRPNINQAVTDQRKYLNDIAARGNAYPEWFWSDDASAAAARDYLYNLKGGEDLINQIYSNTPEELQKTINYKKLPHSISASRTLADQQARTEAAGRQVAKGAAILGGSLLAAEALPAIIENAPAVLNGAKSVWNPVQARTKTYFTRAINGALKNNATGQFVTNAGVNMGRFAPGTDLAGTIANNIRMWTPVGFKKGGKITLQNGGSFSNVVRAVGDTLKTKTYNYSTHTKHIKPNGSVIYGVDTKSYSDRYYDPTKKVPNLLTRIWNGGMKPVPDEIRQNWEEIEKNHAGEITLDKTKLTNGGSLAEKEKINNKYFSKLEKSGRKSSKEMEDLSQARKAALKKVK